jgi:ribosomal protein S18 acetylase RimI-like enzyme
MAYRIQPKDVTQAADVLSASFADYPIFRYVLPDAADRSRGLGRIFRFLVRRALADGEVIAPSERIEGVSIWYRSERVDGSALAALRAGFLGLYLDVGHGAVARLLQVAATKSSHRARLLCRPYCLLDMIGVEPSMQRLGHARKMIEQKLEQLDGERRPCYLETSREGTASYYERYGFELARRYQLAGMDVFCLLREVGAGS